ncbi:MAG: hypothetical protein U9N77_02585 [Thermodesulfobacteriota bacterium]|nr:hypothetical protein [Thermodesulfobacteriota bacterium]
MRQKFTFEIDAKKSIFILSEAGEGEPGFFVPVYHEEYDLEEMRKAAALGRDFFIEKMRGKNFFPPFDLSCKLFEAAKGFFSDEPEEKLVVEYSDVESFPPLDEENEDDDEDDDVELDDLLKEEKENEDLSEDDIKEIDTDDDTPKFQPEDNSEHEN